MFVWIFFSSYTFFKIKSLVLSGGASENRLYMSKEIILFQVGTAILFILKLHNQTNIWKYIQEKYGQEKIKLARNIKNNA